MLPSKPQNPNQNQCILKQSIKFLTGNNGLPVSLLIVTDTHKLLSQIERHIRIFIHKDLHRLSQRYCRKVFYLQEEIRLLFLNSKRNNIYELFSM